ncbi:hypothetical protein R0K04_28905, partial [Pseudoalteromonas sp. SIMBA_153]
LTQQIHDINHFSNNVMAEQVALSIGAYDKSEMAPTMSAGQPIADPNSTSTSNKKPSAQDNSQKIDSLYQFGKPHTTDYS